MAEGNYVHENGVQTQIGPEINGSAGEPSTPITSLPTYFYFPCPTCGRQLKARMRYMGKRVTCPTCCRELLADPLGTARQDSSLERAAELLRQLDEDFSRSEL